MITEIGDFFTKGCGRCARFDTADCSIRPFTEGLNRLRALCLSAGLTEMVKWGHPCYMHAGRNIVIFGAFRGDFRLTFFNAGLMTDPSGVLVKQGANTRHPDMIRFVDNGSVTTLEPVILAYLKEAMSYAEAGIKPDKVADEPDLPDELVDALDSDPELAEAFRNLTPGRQKSYVIHLASAQKPETRIARILKFRPHILSGKGATER